MLNAYVIALFILGVIEAATVVQYNMNAFIYDRGYPGGPFVYFQTFYYLPSITLSDTAYAIAALLADAALVCARLFSTSKYRLSGGSCISYIDYTLSGQTIESF